MCDLSIENDEITCEVQIRINERCSKVNRFKGISMDISSEGQQLLQKVMSLPLSIENLDVVARMLSSNICENYFAILAKHTEGKRINMDKMMI